MSECSVCEGGTHATKVAESPWGPNSTRVRPITVPLRITTVFEGAWVLPISCGIVRQFVNFNSVEVQLYTSRMVMPTSTSAA